MATGRGTQLTRQIGEHLVAAELGRRGLIATPFAGNVPIFDLLAVDEKGRAIPLQLKAINGPSWQFNIQQFLRVELVGRIQHVRGKVRLSHSNLVCILVLLSPERRDSFYILRFRDLQDYFRRTYKGGRRRRNPKSMHCAVWPRDLESFRNRWETVFDVLEGVRS